MNNLENFQHFIGCDVSKKTLDFAIHAKGTDCRRYAHIQVSNTKDGFKQMLKWLKDNKIKLDQTVVAMEHTGIYSEALTHWCHGKRLAFVTLHPLDVKRASNRGRNKTDKDDSQFIADYAYTMREKLQPSSVEPEIINTLRQLYNERRLAVKSRTCYQNQIKTVSNPSIRKRIQEAITFLSNQIAQIEKEIAAVIKEDEAVSNNFKLLKSVPGIGLINAVLTIIATGNFTRFQTPRQYAKFCCVSPISRESGDSIRYGDHVGSAGHSELKSVLTEAARSVVEHNPGFRAFFERKSAQGKSYGCIMNAVKFKLICRMFAVVRRQTPFVDTEAFRS